MKLSGMRACTGVILAGKHDDQRYLCRSGEARYEMLEVLSF